MIDNNELLYLRKIKFFRLGCIFVCFLLFGFIGFLIYNAINSQFDELWMHLVALLSMEAALIIEIIINFKNLKKDLFFYPVAFNDDEHTINKMAFIFMVVVTSIGFILSALFIILYLINNISAYLVLIPISLFLFIHALMFVVYTLMNKGKEFDVRDLIK